MTGEGTTVRLGDGVRIELSDGTAVVADARRPSGDVNVLTHAHGDHLFGSDPGPVVCSRVTADLARVRRPNATVEVATDPRVELVPAGHVAGSRAVVVTDPDGTRTCYTGDVCTRDRLYLRGFEPPDVDVLVLETTYGKPGYVLPPQAELEAEISGWLADTMDRPVLLFGYSLGRAQKLQVLARRAGRDRLFVADAVAEINEAMAPHVDARLDAVPFDGDVDLEAGDAVVLPTGQTRSGLVDRLRERDGALAAGFSGWAVDESFRYRGGYDVTFPLSDHCDFTELCEVVERAGPERVYTNHGFAEEFAAHLAREGWSATALKRNQARLSEF